MAGRAQIWNKRLVGLWLTAIFLLSVPAWALADGFVGQPSLGGITGLVNVPNAVVLPEGTARFGYSVFHKNVVYEGRGRTDNEVYHLNFGLFPRVEVSLRATIFPDFRLIEGDDPTVDRVGSARLLAVRETALVPAVALGVDDARGTRRFHSLYAVTSKTIVIREDRFAVRLSGGWGSRALRAKRHILDGGFGGMELLAGEYGAASVEYDTEKWNLGWGVRVGSRLLVKLALLDWKTASGGIAWEQPLGI